MLFDFITSEGFRSIDRDVLEEQEKAISEITVDVEETTVEPTPALSPVEKLEQSIKSLIKESETEAAEPQIEAEPIQEQEITKAETVTQPEPEPVKHEAEEQTAEETIGKPLAFDAAETHSFAEWLQLSRLKPIERQPEPTDEKNPLDEKLNLIDKFLEATPKIVPVKNDPSPWENLSRTTTEAPGLMTETLARVYLEQKKYAKAIQAYEILILKYPEKSVFFANRISEIKDLQQNNK
ncbi:tetratricopeptide repeat protein [Flavobacterium akiainvivens]|uniref:tetratricopeptide repeat protein n=1 Tax=Flavobacterium akiainvivens TaxID=1202724 RepID=UPI001FD1B071|nr:tetratricopeptide repeat protein [Flavobacterium akiainvivens]